MPITRTQKVIATGAVAIGGLLGAAGITAAATNSGSSNEAEPSYQSSISAPEGAKVDGLATITSDEAAAAATNAVAGTVGEVELENENGNVVYGVEITQADGTKLDVKVDAGNGKVLDKEADNDRDAERGADGD